uniref:Protein containing TUDOR domain n=1 Tax=Rhipicephalus zambeziensis TaxID=60191 RepID=A0A224YZ99_9ACAR
MNQNDQSTSAMSGCASPASTAFSPEPPQRKHQDITPKEEENADILHRLELMLQERGGSVPLSAALELLQREPKWQRLSSTEVLTACLNTRGELNFHAEQGHVIICRGKTPSLHSFTDESPTARGQTTTSPQSSKNESTTQGQMTTSLRSSPNDKPCSTRGPDCCDVSVVQPLPDTGGEQFFPVLVRRVVSPEAVIVNLVGRCMHEFSALLEMMNLFYSTQGIGGIGGHTFRTEDLVAGALCAYPHVDMPISIEENWCRGVVTSVLQNCMVRITDVDSGLKTMKPSTSLRQLASHFRSLPRQAITVKLCRLRSAQGGVWGPEASTRLAQLVDGEIVMCRLVDYVKGVPSVVMCDTNGPEDVYVSSVLIEECLALPMSSDDEN